MTLQIRTSITLNKTHRIISPNELADAINILVEDQSGSFRDNFTEVNEIQKLKPAELEAFVFFAWAILLDFTSTTGRIAPLNDDLLREYLEIIRGRNTGNNNYNDICHVVNTYASTFLQFFKNIITEHNQLQMMLLFSWMEIFTDINEDMNAIRDISVGAITGHAKVITLQKMVAVGFVDSSRISLRA